MKSIPYTEEANQLLLQGAVALSEIECNGIAVDVPYLKNALEKSNRKIKRLQEELEENEVTKIWRKKFRSSTNLESHEQLATILYDEMGFTSTGKTKKGKYRTDEKELSEIDHPFIDLYLRISKLMKAVNTNIEGFLEEQVDGRIHSFFDLHTARSYRSSNSSPNTQNIPNREHRIAKLIRTGVIPSLGRMLIDLDFKGSEVSVSACYNKDPNLISYVTDKSKDMHRDLAIQIFMVPESEFKLGRPEAKMIRFYAKSCFTFAEFYGDWYLSCAQSFWRIIDDPDATTSEGLTLRQHLKRKGITELGVLDARADNKGTFIDHLRRIEEDFWGRRFRVYKQWKEDTHEQYQRDGFLKTLTGFICQGYMEKNQVANYGIQGSSFHCLLWTIIKIMRELKRRNMKTMIVGQIHDSVIADVVPEEKDEYLEIATNIIRNKLPRHYPWLIVPMDVECEITKVDGNWAEKEPFKLAS